MLRRFPTPRRRRRFYRALGASLAAALAGCATAPPLPLPHDDALASRCERAYAALDREVDAAGVRDAEATRVAGFPSLRVTRFLASFAPSLDGATFAAWHARLAAEDRRARLVEIANLPPGPTARVRAALAADGFGTLGPDAFLEGCGGALAERDAADPARRARLVAAARVPDDYDDGARALGLYPLTRIAFAAGVRAYERDVLQAFASRWAASRPVTHVPDAPNALAPAAVQALVARGRGDPLGVPALDEAEIDALLATFAPVVVVDERGGDDRLGRPTLDDAGRPRFVPMPVAFGRLATTRFAGATRVQLVYTFWFAARTPAWAGDPLAGPLDAVVWRVTLDADGAPLAYDTIHGCGCYSLFFPTPRLAARPPQATLDEQALVPATLPRHDAAQRIAIGLEAGTHQVRAVHVAPASTRDAIRYRLGRDDALRSIALPGGGTRSLYGPDGLVAGTERGERAAFWATGIRSAGAMRQWGRHATAFVGRRHFDEPGLLDRYFLPAP